MLVLVYHVFNMCRRERDNSEAERAQHLKQIHDMQERFREKERQLLSMEEQVRIFLCFLFSLPCDEMNQ